LPESLRVGVGPRLEELASLPKRAKIKAKLILRMVAIQQDFQRWLFHVKILP